MSKLLLIDCIPEVRGWSPIRHMISLASRLMDAEVIQVGSESASIRQKLAGILSRSVRNRRPDEACLLIATGPADLIKILRMERWRQRFGFVGAWVIDSFWLNHIPRSVIWSRPFDHLFVTSLADMDAWKRITGSPVTWVPWGSDVLGLGCGEHDREWDLTRVGRQPKEWDDDAACASAASEYGITYRGRPPSEGMTVLENQLNMMRVYSSSKYILAFSNLVNREAYTHPTCDYITGRWVDALACGAVVAGVPPRAEGTSELLWPGATLDFGSVRLREGMATLASALAGWTPAVSVRNHTAALRKLDWRWRFRTIAEAMGITPEPLYRELALLPGSSG
jgi:hypothetical protein